MTKREKKALQRIATAIRSYAAAPERDWSISRLAKEWGVPVSTLNVLVGRDQQPMATSIPRGAMLQLIGRKTGYSLDYLLGLVDAPEKRAISRTLAELERDVVAYIKERVDAGVSPHFIGDEGEFVVHGDRVLRLMVVEALKQAGYITGTDIDPYTILTWRHSPIVQRAEESPKLARTRQRTTQGRKS